MSEFRSHVVRLTTVFFTSVFFALGINAADTSSSLTGFVRDADGSAISGADVSILHVPSGQERTTSSGPSGAFHLSGLRVGGPYEINVSRSGYQNYSEGDISLRPGAQPAVQINLQTEAGDIEQIVVTGSANVAKDLHNGLGSAFSAFNINNQPSATRDVLATLNTDPLAHHLGEGSLSVAGVNPRFNALAIDGSLQQDDFGLSDNTYASSRSPINLDAVESASVVASDYSVQASGFTGGFVNITTKSGTNEWDGSLFSYFKNDGFFGDEYDGDRSYTQAPFDETEWGFTIGGPIREDVLFVFLSYDEYESVESVDFSNFDEAQGVQPGFYDGLNQVIRNLYGVDILSRPAVASTPVTSERVLLKLDWNATDTHRASFTYQSTVESDTGVGADEFESAWVDTPLDLKAYTFQLFSDWSDVFSTTVRYNVKNYSRGQVCRAGPGVGAIEMNNIRAADLVGTPLAGLLADEVDLIAGCDRFRHANDYADERSQLLISADYLLNEHLLTVGIEHEYFELFNLFVPSSRGRFSFNSYSDLINGRARVDYVNVPSNNAADGAAAWGFNKLTAFVQDTWYIGSDLDISAGLRVERFSQEDAPAFSRDILNQYGIRSDENLDNLWHMLPRVSFRYTGLENTTVSGGIGKFSGGDPKVWTSNAFQVPTVFARAFVDNANPSEIPAELLSRVGSAAQGTPIDVISENFKIPVDWKFSLRVEHEIDYDGVPDVFNDILITAQLLSTQTDEGFLWRNLSQTDLNAALPTGIAPDGRIIYADLDDIDLINLTELGNYSGGKSQIYSLAASKSFAMGIDVSASYAYQDVDTVTEGLSSRGISNWRGITDIDRNNPGPRNSPYEKTHSLKASFGYERSFGQLLGRVDLFGSAVSGQRYFFTFDTSSTNSLFGRAGAGESPYDNTPLYIPTGPDDPLVVYSSGFNVDAFFDYIDRYELDAGIMEPYSEDSGLNQIFNLRIQLHIPMFDQLENVVGDGVVKLIFDLENVLNFLNSDWGTFENGPRFGQANIVQADLVSAADVAANGVNAATALRGDAPRTTCTTQSACLYRYRDFDADPTSFVSSFRSVYQMRLGLHLEF